MAPTVKAKSPLKDISLVGIRAKLAVSVIGPFIVIGAGLLFPEYDPLPLPVQPLKLYPSEAVALAFTFAPLLVQSLPGLTLPPVPAFVVR
jgi:hypothetical protein